MSNSSIREAATCMYIQQLHFILLLLNEFLHCFYIYAVFSKVLREAVLDMIAVLFSSHFQYLTSFTLELLHFSLCILIFQSLLNSLLFFGSQTCTFSYTYS